MAYEPPPGDETDLPEVDDASEERSPKLPSETPSLSTLKKADPADYSTLPASYLNVLGKAKPETYEAEIPNAGWGKTLLGVAIVTVVSFGIKLILAPSTIASLDESRRYLASQGQDPNNEPWKSLLQTAEASTSPLLSLSVPVTFFAGAALLYFIAGIVRGKENRAASPSFMTHSYLLSLSYTPLLTLSAIVTLLSLVPVANCLGAIIGLGIHIYQIYNSGLAMQASFKLDGSKAQMVAFIPWLVGILLTIVITAVTFVSVMSTIVR